MPQQSRRGGSALARVVRGLLDQGQTDYAMEPVVLVDRAGQPLGRIANGDSVIFCCRRGEREIQLTEAFTEADFPHFPRPPLPDLNFIILTLYHEKFKDLPVAFAPSRIPGTLGEAVSRAGLRQLRLSESEKFTHVTFFLNGGSSQPFAGEDRLRVPSPQGIPFDQTPGLHLDQVTGELLAGIERGYDLIVTNFANGDVIGHTANCAAKIQCAAIVDSALGQVLAAALPAGYVVLVTADHGNLEEMSTSKGEPHVAHTTNPVACVLIDPLAAAPAALQDGALCDLAPTLLVALGVPEPPEMRGKNLAPGYPWGGPRKVLLLILDGWGLGRADESNPIHLAATPAWDGLLERYPHSQLQASGEAVGLQARKTGNSEAGHMNIGAGRVVLQDDVRLDLAMQDGSFAQNEIFAQAMRRTVETNTHLHLIGLLTENSSHGSIDYPLALLRMAKTCGLEQQVYLHLIFDGRSTPPGSAPAMLEALEARMDEIGAGQIVSGIGRGIALDRDGNYSKTRRAFEAFVLGAGISAVLD